MWRCPNDQRVIIAGFGGQGVMSMGKTLTEAGLKEGYEVSWVPSYGPEMRGGTANCAVVLSDEPIGSPVVNRPSELIAMNGPSLSKFEPSVIPGGLILVNASQAEQKVERQDARPLHPLHGGGGQAGQLQGGQYDHAGRLHQGHRRP